MPPGPGVTLVRVVDLESRLRAAGCVFAEDEAAAMLEAFDTPEELEAAVVRRESGEPLEYVVGHARFDGLRIRLLPGVFVPRPRAEPLVWAASQELRRRGGPAKVLDLGCGSGALAAAIAARSGSAEITATDIDPPAVRCARLNAIRWGFTVLCADWFGGLPAECRGGFDVVVAYLPHVPAADLPGLPRDYREAEPELSVHGGVDGLDPLRRVLTGLDGWLAEDGVFLTLLGASQLDDAASLARARGFIAGWRDSADTLILAVRRGGSAVSRHSV